MKMKRTTYTGSRLREISFPLGGIGSGSIGLAGNGGFIDWEIFNRPSKGSYNGHTHFAIKTNSKDGKLLDARVLMGDAQKNFAGTGMGLTSQSMAGFPHFRDCTFTGEFPIAKIDFADVNFPGRALLTAFNPLIPRQEDDSSLPAAFFEVSVTNTTNQPLDYTFCFTTKNPWRDSVNTASIDGNRGYIRFGRSDNVPADSIEYGELCAAVDTGCESNSPQIQEYWYRGGWCDALETYWRNFTEYDYLKPRHYSSTDTANRNGDHGSLAVKLSAKPGETVSARFILAWYIPNNYNYWSPLKKKNADGSDGADVTWRNYYAVLWKSAEDVVRYALDDWNKLWTATDSFRKTLFSSTLPEPVIEAASATLSVLKSPTVLRLENGKLYGWEGVHQNTGSCEGSCTHVWNYTYAAAFLFPALERSMRELDFDYNFEDTGRMPFRMQLPLGRGRSGFRACVDGQMGGVIKSWREWKISGDTEWLCTYWPRIKKSLEYAWSPDNPDRWDADKDGVLEGRQHHTLDMELFGPSSWLEGFYLAALKAGAEMAEAMGEPESAAEYRELFARGSEWSEKNLFNGKWYIQKIDLYDRDILDKYSPGDRDVTGRQNPYWNSEAGQIKYQIGEGSEIDQLCGQWHANIIGLGRIFDENNTKTALRSMYDHNFCRSVREHYNPWRIFSLNDESGSYICVYPEGAEKPAIPIPYCQETMHGFEYQLAGLMASEGMVNEAVELVTSIRDRYNGENRNPWNEIECGNNYARSMASWAMIPILSGFSFDMTKGKIGFAPKPEVMTEGSFSCVWSLDCAWGNVVITADSLTLTIADGALPLRELSLPFSAEGIKLEIDGKPVPFTADGCRVLLDSACPVTDSAVLRR